MTVVAILEHPLHVAHPAFCPHTREMSLQDHIVTIMEMVLRDTHDRIACHRCYGTNALLGTRARHGQDRPFPLAHRTFWSWYRLASGTGRRPGHEGRCIGLAVDGHGPSGVLSLHIRLPGWERLPRDWRPGEFLGLKPVGPPRGADVSWRLSGDLAAPGWFQVGDAAAVLEPTSANGILHTLLYGMIAARFFHFIMLTLKTLGQTNVLISSFRPTSAKVRDLVTLSGVGFSTTASQNVVIFGATRAEVVTPSATYLSEKVPAGATYGPISVTNLLTGLTSVSRGYFLATFSADSKVPILAENINFQSGGSDNAEGIAVSDFDGDGKPDIVMDLQDGGSWVFVCRNTSVSGSISTSSFASAVKFGFSGPPHSASDPVVGDVDGDGRPRISTGMAVSIC